MPPITTTEGCHAQVFEALQRAEERWQDVTFAAALQGEEYDLAAAGRGQCVSQRVPVCIINNPEAGAALYHFFGQLREQVLAASVAAAKERGPPG